MNKQEQDFGRLMKNHRPERAPLDFSKRVMDEIYQVEKLMKQQPVFNKWFLAAMSLAFALVVGLAIWGGGSGKAASENPVLGRLGQLFDGASMPAIDSAGRQLSSFFSAVPPVLLFTLLGLFLLLLLDRILQHRRIMQKTK